VTVLGSGQRRLEGRLKVTGKSAYVADLSGTGSLTQRWS
jgi:CO/xanthine dehydrogenase Mo-binding subunit